MDFKLSEEQQAIQAMADKFAEEKLAPNAGKWDEEKTFPKDTLQQAAQLGFAAIYLNEDIGGIGLGRFETMLIFASLAKGCVASSAYLSIHNMVAGMIDQYGTQGQREKYLPKMVSLEYFSSYCLTEPSCGSDASALKTKAIKKDGHYIINGTKAFISGAGHADIYLVMARTSDNGAKGISAFIIDKSCKGISFGEPERKMGWNAQPTALVNFDNCKISSEQLLGTEGMGFNYAMAALDGGRLNIAACSLGAAEFAITQSIQYVKDRHAFGKAIAQFQNIQFTLSDMKMRLEASRSLLYRAAWAFDNNLPEKTSLCAMAKKITTDDCFDIVNKALQIHGGYGYLKDFPFERMLRDIRVHQILEGTNEIMSLIVARKLLA